MKRNKGSAREFYQTRRSLRERRLIFFEKKPHDESLRHTTHPSFLSYAMKTSSPHLSDKVNEGGYNNGQTVGKGLDRVRCHRRDYSRVCGPFGGRS